MERLGAQLHTAQGTYDSAMNTLTRGRGNLISQANRFVELGVRVKRELPKGIMDQAEVDDDDEFRDTGDNDLPDSEKQAIGADNEQE